MSIRQYNPSVRIGNWMEELQLEEDTIKHFLESRDKGELQIQKNQRVQAAIHKPVALSTSNDYSLHIGDRVMLKCRAATQVSEQGSQGQLRQECVVAINVTDPMQLVDKNHTGPMFATGCVHVQPNMRTVFCVESIEGGQVGHKLRYGEPFYLTTVMETIRKMYLCSDRALFNKCAKRSGHQEIFLDDKPSFLAQWMVQHKNPLRRLEFEYVPVEANEEMVLVHCKTNQCLAVEENYLTRTALGREYELSGHTYLDSHRAEKGMNHWILVVGVAGSSVHPIPEQGPGPAPLHPVSY